MTNSVHAKITAYKGKIVCELVAKSSIPNEVNTSLDNPTTMGQIIHNTEKHLGVSDEALKLMRTLKRGSDSLGDIDWFETGGGTASFGWLGGPYNIIDAAECEPSRDFKILKYVRIPNDVPDGAKEHIDCD